MKSKASAASTDFVFGYEGKMVPNLNGVFEIGTLLPEPDKKKPVKISFEQCLSHIEVLGLDVHLRTRMVDQICLNAIKQNWPLVYLDGSGSSSRAARFLQLVSQSGRASDCALLDYTSKQGEDFSSALFQNLDADVLAEILLGCVEPDFYITRSQTGDLWAQRCRDFLKGMMNSLVSLRDEGKIELSLQTLKDSFTLDGVFDLAFGKNDDKAIGTGPLIDFLRSVPYFELEKKRGQRQLTLDQIGYLILMLNRTISDLFVHGVDDDEEIVKPLNLEDSIANGKVAYVKLPSMQEEFAGDNREYLARFNLMASLETIKAIAASKNNRPMLLVIDCFDAVLPHDLDRHVASISEANASLLFAWKSSRSPHS